MFKCTITKWPVQKRTHRTTQKNVQQHDATYIYNNFIFMSFGFFVFYFLFYLNFLKWILQEMLSYRLGTVNDFYWEFSPRNVELPSWMLKTVGEHFLQIVYRLVFRILFEYCLMSVTLRCVKHLCVFSPQLID